MSEESPAKQPFLTQQRIEIAIASVFVIAFLFGGPKLLSSICSKSEIGEKPIAYSLFLNGHSNETYTSAPHQRAIKPTVTAAAAEIEASDHVEAAPDDGRKAK